MLISKFPMGVKIETGQISNLAAAAVENTPGSINLTWTNPTGYKYFSGVMIRCKVGSYPTSINDGALVYDGSGTSVTVTGLTGGMNYCFRTFTYAKNKSGTKVVYNSETAGAQTSRYTLCEPIALTVGSRKSNSIAINWNSTSNPSRAIYLVRKAGGYPSGINDGTQIYVAWNADAGNINDTGLVSYTTYYYRAFVHNAEGVFNTNTSQQIAANTKVAAGQVVFTTSQGYTIPAGVSVIDIFCVGGGGGSASPGAGGGYTQTWKNVAVAPGWSASVIIGAGGEKFKDSYTIATDGGTTTFSVGGSNFSALGGKHTTAQGVGYDNGGAGGSGGGGYQYSEGGGSWGSEATGGNGGVDGGNGADGLRWTNKDTGVWRWITNQFYAGPGQGRTTRAFEESWNTLYSGGGGGACYCHENLNVSGYRSVQGMGGAGGGGNGCFSGYYGVLSAGSDGTPNTGGGAGGGSHNGGSGVCIIRWAEQ
jgi:hypothetical protein